MNMQLSETWYPFLLLIPAILYAEIHYRFPFFPFSRYNRREPEIIADAPHRLEPGASLPLLLLVKDAHRFPIYLRTVRVRLYDESGEEKTLSFQKGIAIRDPWWHETLSLNADGLSRNCSIEVEFTYEVAGTIRSCVNHNVRGSEQKPLRTFVSSSSLPGRGEGWLWGDLHCHTWLTDDFVEFGAPITATREAAEACGLSFLALTDHSYDLDDEPGSWTKPDPELSKWNQSQTEIKRLNGDGLPILIPGEEVTSTNAKGRNVHALVLNHPEFIPGSGDSGERWLRTRSELSIEGIVKEIDDNGLVVAAHPRKVPGLLQRLLLKRGYWEEEDFRLSGLSGFQILNGTFDEAFRDGLRQWIRRLLEGNKQFIYAGNDAHGNFNRFRQVKIPMFSVWDHDNQVLGKCRTGINLKEVTTLDSIIQSLKHGRCVVSNGPLLDMTAEDETSSYTLGETISTNNLGISLRLYSSKEFGSLKEVRVFFGDVDQGEEETLLTRRFEKGEYEKRDAFRTAITGRKGYVRGELVTSESSGEEFCCLTNPIWINLDQ